MLLYMHSSMGRTNAFMPAPGCSFFNASFLHIIHLLYYPGSPAFFSFIHRNNLIFFFPFIIAIKSSKRS
jgi:hypothetical protein